MTNGWDIFRHGLGLTSRIALLIPVCLIVAFLLGLLLSLFRAVERAHEVARGREAWRRYGPKWLGLVAQRDEAVAACRATVGIYVSGLFRLPLPGNPPRPSSPLSAGGLIGLALWPFKVAGWAASWALVPGFNYLVMPLAERVVNLVLRAKAQGADRFGPCSAAIATEPVPHANSRKFLPPELASRLEEYARNRAKESFGQTHAWVAEQLSLAAKGGQDAGAVAKAFGSNLKMTQDLIHNCYPHLPELRGLMAAHILRHCGPHTSGETPPQANEPTAWQWWLETVPGAAEERRLARPPPRSCRTAGRTSLSTGRRGSRESLLALLLTGLFTVGLVGLPEDIRGNYFPHLAGQVPASNSDGDEDLGQIKAVERMRQFGPFAETFLREGIKQQLDQTDGEQKAAVALVPAMRLLAETATTRDSVAPIGEVFVQSGRFGREPRREAGLALLRLASGREGGKRTDDGVRLEAPKALATGLKKGDRDVRRQAAYLIGEVNHDGQDFTSPEAGKVVPASADALASDDWYVHIRAVHALGNMKGLPSEVIEKVIAKLKLDDPALGFAQTVMIKSFEPQAVKDATDSVMKSSPDDYANQLGRRPHAIGDSRPAPFDPIFTAPTRRKRPSRRPFSFTKGFRRRKPSSYWSSC